MKRIKDFLKKETVFAVATLLAVISAFFVPPSTKYISYIDFKTLITLLVLMLVVQFFSALGVFDRIIHKILSAVNNTRGLIMSLVLICFFSAMLITNDVALITFVPFTLLLLGKAGKKNIMIPTVALQTIAANLGSMLTPIGNPQNLYLYQLSKISLPGFITLMLPYAAVSLLMLLISTLFLPVSSITPISEDTPGLNTSRLLVRTVKGVDFFLLLTFISFFILIGNLQNISAVRTFFEQVIKGREFLCAVIASQIISNVPAAMMLSGFSDNYTELLAGVNIGGLGTLIASMASLISYKIYASNYGETKGKYLLFFTGINLVFLLPLCFVHFLLMS